MKYKKISMRNVNYLQCFAEYPAFQDLLLVNEFPKLAVNIAETESESYVRASALTFIATTVRINKLWEQQLSELNLNVCIVSY